MTYLVVNWASRAFDGDVGAKVEIELEGMGASSLDQSTRKRVAVLVTLLRKEADMVTLSGNDDGELGRHLGAHLSEALPHVANLLIDDSSVLALGNTVANVEDALWHCTSSDLLHPHLG